MNKKEEFLKSFHVEELLSYKNPKNSYDLLSKLLQEPLLIKIIIIPYIQVNHKKN